MKRFVLVSIQILALIALSSTAKAQSRDQRCEGQCWDGSVIFTLGCVAGGGSPSYCSQAGHQWGLECIVANCVFASIEKREPGSKRWPLPYHATSDQLQTFACQRYGTRSDVKLHNGYCSGRAGLAQIGDDEDLTIISDVQRGAKAQWQSFDSAKFKIWLKTVGKNNLNAEAK